MRISETTTFYWFAVGARSDVSRGKQGTHTNRLSNKVRRLRHLHVELWYVAIASERTKKTYGFLLPEVVLAASIVTKSGRPVLSRQFREMPRSRIEGLLTSFPKLIPANSQHTSVETADVRYVYQPLEDLYILLITNKASNILLDIDTLHLVSRVVSDLAHSPGEQEILRNSFEIIGAFDEIISLGYREQVNLMQVRNVLEMESHEEKIQEMISRASQIS